ncbi:MAG: glycoside hydrolase domain-containing protein [Oligosphaeraceae bacterium]
MLMTSVLLLGQVQPEITRGDYAVRLTGEGPKMFWRGEVLSANTRPCLVVGPGWQHTLVGDSFWKEAEIRQEGDRLVAKKREKDFQAEISFQVSEEGIQATVEFSTDLAPLDDASFWFMTLPQELCGGTLFTQDAPETLFLMPPAFARESVPQSRWRITRDATLFQLFTPKGTLRVSSPTPFYVFDGRYHVHFPVNARTISLVNGGRLPMGKRCVFTISMDPSLVLTPLRFSTRPPFPLLQTPDSPSPWNAPLSLAAASQPDTPAPAVTARLQEGNLLFHFQCPSTAERLELHLQTEDGSWYKRFLLAPEETEGLQLGHEGGKALYELTREQVEYATAPLAEGGWEATLSVPLFALGVAPEELPKRGARVLWESPYGRHSYPAPAPDGEIPFAAFLPTADLPATLDASAEHELPAGRNWLTFQVENRSSLPMPLLALARLSPDSQSKATTSAVDYQTAQVTGPTITDQNGRLTQETCLCLPPRAAGLLSLPLEVSPEDTQIQPILLSPAGFGLASSLPLFRSALSYLAELSRVPGRLENWPDGCPAEEKADLLRQAGELQEAFQSNPAPQRRQELQHACQRLLQGLEKREMCLAQGRAQALSQGWDYQLFSSLDTCLAEHLDKDVPLGGGVNWTLAADETGNAQIALLPLSAAPVTLPVRFSPLLSQEGNSLPADALRLFREEEILASGKPYFDRLRPATQITLSAQENQVLLWLQVTVPPRTPAGLYQGTLTLGDVAIPLQLQVLPWQLPRGERVFALAGYGVEEFPTREMSDRFARTLMEYDLYPQRGNAWPSFMDSELDGDHFGLDNLSPELLARFHRLTLGTFPWLGWLTEHYKGGRYEGNPAAYYAAASEKVLQAARALREENTPYPLYVYYDEIGTREDVVKDMLWNLKNKGNLRVCAAFCAPHLGTDRIRYYEDLVDLFYFSDKHFVQQEMLDYIRGLKEKGKEIGWYFNLSYPKFPTSNMIDAPGTAKRIQFFCQWKYKVDISLFWGANSWSLFNGQNWKAEPLEKSGDGLLFYPDDTLGFLPSVRAELLREGAQDYRALLFLHSLREKADSLQIPLGENLRRQLDHILAVDWVASVTDYPEDPAVLLEQRKRLNQAITTLLQLLP